MPRFAVFLLAGALAGCSSCGDDSPLDVIGGGVPWAPGSDAAIYRGQVVTPDGEPVAGAEVRLIYPGDPHWPEDVAGEARTDADGRFAFEPVSPFGGYEVVVRGNGGERTFSPPLHERDEPPPPVTIRVAESYPLMVRARCTEPPRNVSDHLRREPVRLDVRWLPEEDDLLIRAFLAPPDGDASTRDSELMPGRPGSWPRSEGATRFSRSIALPAGRHRLTFTGPCGVRVREVEIDDDAPPTPIDVDLPAPDHGTLAVELGSQSTRDVLRPRLHVGPVLLEWLELRPGAPVVRERLAPGAYRLTRATCHQPIELAPSTRTTVTIGPGRCDVRAGPPPTEETPPARSEAPIWVGVTRDRAREVMGEPDWVTDDVDGWLSVGVSARFDAEGRAWLVSFGVSLASELRPYPRFEGRVGSMAVGEPAPEDLERRARSVRRSSRSQVFTLPTEDPAVNLEVWVHARPFEQGGETFPAGTIRSIDAVRAE